MAKIKNHIVTQSDYILSRALSISTLFNVSSDNLTEETRPILPSKLTLTLPYCRNISQAFGQYLPYPPYCVNVIELVLYLYHPVVAVQLLYRNSSIKKLIFPNGITLTSSHYQIVVSNVLETIEGVIDFDVKEKVGSYIAYTCFKEATVLKDITFAYNCFYFSYQFNSQYLTKQSIISIANACNEDETERSITLASTPKALCSTIIGTSTLDPTQTFHIFTEDPSGTMSLEEFITTVKGWTLS